MTELNLPESIHWMFNEPVTKQIFSLKVMQMKIIWSMITESVAKEVEEVHFDMAQCHLLYLGQLFEITLLTFDPSCT